MLPNELPLERHAGTLGVSSITKPRSARPLRTPSATAQFFSLRAVARASSKRATADLRIIAVITGQVGRERHHFHRVGLPHLGGRHIDAEHVHELHDGVARLAHGGGLFSRKGLRIGHKRIRIAHEREDLTQGRRRVEVVIHGLGEARTRTATRSVSAAASSVAARAAAGVSGSRAASPRGVPVSSSQSRAFTAFSIRVRAGVGLGNALLAEHERLR